MNRTASRTEPPPDLLTAGRVLAGVTAVAAWGSFALLVRWSAADFPPAAWGALGGALVATWAVVAVPRATSAAAHGAVVGWHLPWVLLPTAYAFLALPVAGLATAAGCLSVAASRRTGPAVAAAIIGLVIGVGVHAATWLLAGG